MFFLTDVYGDHDFSRRDANVAKVMPMMQRLFAQPKNSIYKAAMEELSPA